MAASRPLQIVEGAGRGAAAAINTGILAARYPLIAQVDQDVVIDTEWLLRLVGELDDLGIAAAQGQYVVDQAAPLVARAMAIDLAQRYSAIRNKQTSHVCTGNSLYRAAALHQVGLFDESLGYGYDNDMSYRLIAGWLPVDVLPRRAQPTSLAQHALGLCSRSSTGSGTGASMSSRSIPDELPATRFLPLP